MPMISLGTPSFPNDELVYLVLNYQSEARLVRRRRCMRFSNDSVLLWNQLLQLLFLKKKVIAIIVRQIPDPAGKQN
jgi:hypothetical protein